MNPRVRHLLSSLAALAVLALAPCAVASPGAVVRDCAEDGSLDGSYSEADKRAALGQIPADLDEYSDCRSLIAGGIGGGKGASASAIDSSPTGRATSPAAVRRASAQRARKVREARRRRTRQARERELGARSVDPRDADVFRAANTANGLPRPVAAALVALALLALVPALLTLWRRNPAFAGVLRRVVPRRLRR